MRILFLSAFLPGPSADSAGVLDVYEIARELCAKHEVTMLTMYHDEQELRDLPVLREICSRVVTVSSHFGPGTLNYKILTVVSLLSSLPAIALASFSWRFVRQLKQILQEIQPDLIFVEFTQMASYRKFFPKYPAVIDEGDIAFVRRGRHLRILPFGFKKAILFLDTLKLKKYEFKQLNLYDMILVRTDHDRDTLSSHIPAKRIEIFPACADAARGFTVSPAGNSVDLMFFGAMWRSVNSDAAQYFVEKVLPIVNESRPDAKFYVVGSRPPRSLQKFASDRVIITGFVRDFDKYYQQSALIVAPLRSGSGIKCKVVQGLAAGRPVVATSVGAEGINATEDDGLFVCDEPTQMASKIIWLLEKGRYKQYGVRAQEYVRAHHDWDAGMLRLLRAIERASGSEGIS